MQLSSHCCKRLALSVTALVLLLAVSQPAQAQTYHAGAGLTLTGTTFSVANGGVTGAMIGLPLSLSASSSSPILTVTNTGSGYGILSASSGGDGLHGTSSGSGHAGVAGIHSSSGYGVYGGSTSGTGVYGKNQTSGDYGFLGGTDPVYKAPAGVFGSDPSSAGGDGVFGDSNKGSGVAGVSARGLGVLGVSSNNDGVYGINQASGNGDYGFLGGTDPIYKAPAGVFGSDPSSYGGNGVFGDSNYGSGVAGVSTSGDGGFFSTSSGTAVYGMNGGNGAYGFLGGKDPIFNEPAGVFGSGQSSGGNNGNGVFGDSNKGNGVQGYSTSGSGVFGDSTNDIGVQGYSASGDGVVGATGSTDGIAGIYGYAPSGSYAGHFYGNVSVSGTLTAGAKNFKIDHPLDPEHKYLYHASIESNEMTDLYSGNVTTDAGGNATVTMPSWFGALNTDFRYQLTCIGQFAQAIVGSKVKDNRFTIKTDKPDVEVSWQVTGVRHDAFALAHPMQVEQDKPEREQGLYQNPEAFGQPESMGTGYAHRHRSLRPAGGG